MWNLKIKMLLVGVTCVAVYAALPAAEDQDPTVTRVDLGRQEIEATGTALVSEGNRLLSEAVKDSEKYFQARDKYLAAIREFNRFGSGQAFQAEIEYCRNQIARCYYDKACDAMLKAEQSAQRGDFENAIAVCKEAIKYCPEQVEQLQEKIARYEKRRDAAIVMDERSRNNLLPDLQRQELEIQILLEQGRRLAAKHQYTLALSKFQEVLLISPYEAEAINNIRAINARITRIGNQRYADSHRSLIAEVEWKYSIPPVPEVDHNDATVNFVEAPQEKVEESSDAIMKKLESIKIPLLDFNDVSALLAFRDLRERTRQQDPERRGINILLLRELPQPQVQVMNPNAMGMQGMDPSMMDPSMMNPGMTPGDPAMMGQQGMYMQPQQQRQNDTMFGDELSEEDEESKWPSITTKIQDATVLQAIESMCQLAKLRWRIDDEAVVIVPEELPLDDMETRLFVFDSGKGKTESELREDFEPDGVDFPPGARILFNNQINRLIVTNTKDNLKRLEAAINERLRDQKPKPMIQCMVKFIEISQNDLNELAFNWQFQVNSNTSRVDSNGNLSQSTIIGENSNELLRYYRPDEASSGDSAAGEGNSSIEDSTFTYAWENSDGTKIIASMFALDWADSTDVLFSPRVTSLPGQWAEVKMTTTRYFPEDWELMDIEDSDNVYGWHMTGADPQPSLDNEQELGVVFRVKLDWDEERELISVEFDDQGLPIRTFSGWMEFDARTVDSEGDVDGEYYKMPIIDTRRLFTKVMVFDGETVILGGVAQDVTNEINDKIPILGDLPIVGRLFKSKYNDSAKTNLLIFMTCRLVNPNGSAYYPANKKARGIPMFDYNH